MTDPKERAEGLMLGIEQIRGDLSEAEKRALAVGIIERGITRALAEYAAALELLSQNEQK